MVSDEQIALGLYEKAMPTFLSWEEKLNFCKEAGFGWLELSIDETEERLARLNWSGAERDELKRVMMKTGVKMNTMCLSAHRRFPLGSLQPDTEKRSLEIMRKAVDLASDLGIRIIQMAGYDVYYEKGSEKTRQKFGENLSEAVRMASQNGILLGFETMETPFMDTVEKAMVYVRGQKSPYLGIYPDIGNLTNAAELYGHDVLEDIERGRGHILAAHLKETRTGQYREVPFGSGHTDFVSCARVLKTMGVWLFTAEFWYAGQENWKQDCMEAGIFLRQKLREAFGE